MRSCLNTFFGHGICLPNLPTWNSDSGYIAPQCINVVGHTTLGIGGVFARRALIEALIDSDDFALLSLDLGGLRQLLNLAEQERLQNFCILSFT